MMVGVRMRMRVRRAPGITLLPGGGRVRTGHLLFFFVSHSRPGIHSGFSTEFFLLFLLDVRCDFHIITQDSTPYLSSIFNNKLSVYYISRYHFKSYVILINFVINFVINGIFFPLLVIYLFYINYYKNVNFQYVLLRREIIYWLYTIWSLQS